MAIQINKNMEHFKKQNINVNHNIVFKCMKMKKILYFIDTVSELKLCV